MKQVFTYFVLGFCFMLLQSTCFARVLPLDLKPDLMLVLIIYVALNERLLPGGIIAATLGVLQDVFSGSFLGLYGFVLLVVFLVGRAAVSRLNAESSVLLMFLVLWGTVVEAALVIFSVGFFADSGPIWPIVLRGLLPQLFLNLASALVLFKLSVLLQKRFLPHLVIPGLQHLDSRHES